MICLNFMNFSNSIIGKNDDYKYSNNINTKFKKYFFVGFGLIINYKYLKSKFCIVFKIKN